MEQKGLRSQIDSNELQGGLGTVSEQAKSSIEITLAAESGLGYGEGSISHRAGTERVGIEVVKQAEAVINSSIILTDISVDSEGLSIEDDGCGDGREAGVILQGDTEIKKPSLNRAKVFGGGATMAVAARIGVDGLSEQTLGEEFKVAMDELDEKYIGFGAHTDSHAHGENCGCGAIDKAPEIIANTVKFRDQITATIKALGIEDDLTSVFEKFLDASIRTKDQEFSGKQVSESIKAHDKITKRLLGGHEEQYIVLNFISGKTVDQHVVRQTTDDQVQVFATDVWRLQEIAQKLYPEDPQRQNKAFLGELIYTLSVAATLTDGTLPVYIVK